MFYRKTMDIFVYFNIKYEIKDGLIYCKETKKPHKIKGTDYWLCYKRNNKYMAVSYTETHTHDFDDLYIFTDQCLGWSYNIYDTPNEAINERICYNILLKIYDEDIARTLLYIFYKNGFRFKSRAPSLLIFCAAKMYSKVKKDGMLITKWHPPIHILEQFCSNVVHGWKSYDIKHDNSTLYGSINKKEWLCCVSENKNAYDYDDTLIYQGIFVKFIKYHNKKSILWQ